MKHYFTLIILLVLTLVTKAQSRKGDFRLQPGCSSHTLYISFNKDIAAAGETNFNLAANSEIEGYAALSREYDITITYALPFTDAKLKQMESDALKISGTGTSVQKLKNIFILSVSDAHNNKLYELAGKLERLTDVEYCSLMPNEPIRPPGDIAPTTPDFMPLQNYIGTDGVNMEYAWLEGLTGQNINIRDVEYGFNKNHEELVDVNTAVGPGITISSQVNTDFTEHGTAVLGVLYADNGGYGTTGMAYGATEVLLYPEYSVQAGYNRAYTVARAIDNSLQGDVILYEMQMPGAQGQYGPAEYDNVIWDLTRAASDAGILIIAAAGNGAENLDAAAYTSYMNRGDSGAVMVGAGSPDVLHDRLDFSTYGTRVDVQGWGYSVFTTGYEDNPMLNNDFNQRYTYFSGTSSATPIVASCAVVLQSYYFSLFGEFMTGVQMRELLKVTGKPQGNGLQGNIGPLPDMEAAIQKVQNDFLTVPVAANDLNVIVYPNPVQDILTVTANNLSVNAGVKIYNVLGQAVYAGPLKSNTVNVSMLSNGIYTVVFTDGHKSVTKKVVKK